MSDNTSFESGASGVLRSLFSKFRSNTDTARVRQQSSTTKTLSSTPTPPSSRTSTPLSAHSPASSSRSSSVSRSYGKCIDTLGSGVSAKVELYHLKNTDHLYAIKTFKPRELYESRQDYKARCYREYDICHGLKHPNILVCYDFISGFQSHQIVMEYVPYTLLKLIQSTKPSEDELMCFFRQICEGVLYLHSHLIAHRDLKMENICIDDTATVKIIDFGTAFQFGPQHTMARGCVGTEALMSPEALSRISYDAEANDVWGVGVLLYSMLHLEFPWKAAVKSDINFKRFEEHSADLRDKFTEGYGELITKLLSIDPQHRISMKELNEELTKTIPHHISCDEKLHRRTMRVCGSKIAKLLSKR